MSRQHVAHGKKESEYNLQFTRPNKPVLQRDSWVMAWMYSRNTIRKKSKKIKLYLKITSSVFDYNPDRRRGLCLSQKRRRVHCPDRLSRLISAVHLRPGLSQRKKQTVLWVCLNETVQNTAAISNGGGLKAKSAQLFYAQHVTISLSFVNRYDNE